eukprot:NODE_6825_length_480_cov_123.781176.p5 GENE.NODE_6825_length_480_cov_123.781176~~NODE_6825_length_480_cov_123.781176.p5  ORF type:complete len:73 (+),score=41.42 NODE_6825_length_480_cov_123.781176:226-444(+)
MPECRHIFESGLGRVRRDSVARAEGTASIGAAAGAVAEPIGSIVGEVELSGKNNTKKKKKKKKKPPGFFFFF